jgi:hypothetical protein
MRLSSLEMPADALFGDPVSLSIVESQTMVRKYSRSLQLMSDIGAKAARPTTRVAPMRMT